MRKGLLVGFVVYLVFGIYFLNASLPFVEIPEFILKFDRWITLVGSILIIVGAINYIRVSRRKKVFPGI